MPTTCWICSPRWDDEPGSPGGAREGGRNTRSSRDRYLGLGMSTFLRALVRARGVHEAFSLARVLAPAVVLRALAGALSLARVGSDALDLGGLNLGATGRRSHS